MVSKNLPLALASLMPSGLSTLQCRRLRTLQSSYPSVGATYPRTTLTLVRRRPPQGGGIYSHRHRKLPHLCPPGRLIRYLLGKQRIQTSYTSRWSIRVNQRRHSCTHVAFAQTVLRSVGATTPPVRRHRRMGRASRRLVPAASPVAACVMTYHCLLGRDGTRDRL